MAELRDYQQFKGRHWETGTVANYFAYRGFVAPHTRRPYSEALLMGVSGGAVMGYFPFDYEGYDPMARVLTRNTFDPWGRMLSRLGVAQNVMQTAKPEAAARNLADALAEGTPAIVWADMWSLPYNVLAYDEGMWAMFPVLVYGVDEANGQVLIADRARVGLTASAEAFAAARARAKNNKHRLITLEAPDAAKLPAAVSAGIWDSIRLYTETPPKGGRNSFGFAAYRHWAELLTKPGPRVSWARQFPAGPEMLAGLTSAYSDIALSGKGRRNFADRAMFADFLDEAAVILGRPGLERAAGRFRDTALAWEVMTHRLLPDDVALLRETRELMAERHEAFLEHGNAAAERMAEIDGRLAAIRAAISDGFPLSPAAVEAHRAAMAEQLLVIHDIETEAVDDMKSAMA